MRHWISGLQLFSAKKLKQLGRDIFVMTEILMAEMIFRSRFGRQLKDLMSW